MMPRARRAGRGEATKASNETAPSQGRSRPPPTNSRPASRDAIEAATRIALTSISRRRTKRAFAFGMVLALVIAAAIGSAGLGRRAAGHRLWRRHHRRLDRMAEERRRGSTPMRRDGRPHRRIAHRIGRRGRVLCAHRRCRPAARRPLRRALERRSRRKPGSGPSPCTSGRSARRQLGAAARLHQPGDHPQRGWSFDSSRAARAPATGCRPAGRRYLLVLRLYDTPVGMATRTGREAPMPAITKRACCDPRGTMAADRCCSPASSPRDGSRAAAG